MAIQFCDNYSIYGTSLGPLLDGVYAETNGFLASLVADPDGSGDTVFLGQSVTLNGYQPYLRYVLQSPQNIVGIAHRMWMASLPDDPTATPCLTWRNGANNLIIGIGCDTTGQLYAYGAAGIAAPLGVTDSPVVTASGWWHVEAKVNVSAGTFQIRVEGQTVLNLTGLALGASPVAQMSYGVEHGAGGFNVPTYRKDLVIWDGTGALNNDFLGGVLVASMIPNSDDVVGGWLNTGAASHFAALATVPPADATVFISAAIPPIVAAQVGMTDLPVNTTSVKALMTFVRATKADGGDGQLQVSLVSGASTGLGANRPITSTPTYWRDVFEVDPATSAAWTVGAANNTKMKIDRTL